VPESNASRQRTSLLGRILSRLAAIERHETPAVVAAFCLFFCILGGYFAVRPVRDTVGTIIGRDRVADLWLATWAFSLAIVPLYGAAVSKFRRSVFLPWTYGLVAASLAIVGVLLTPDGAKIVAAAFGRFGVLLTAEGANVAAGQFFYVFISVLNLFLISVFWSFLVELFESGQAKRLFPVIAAGGTGGALAGPLFTDLAVRTIGNEGVLVAGSGLFVLAIVCQRALIAVWTSGRGPRAGDTAAMAQARDRALGGNPVAGVRLVLRSPYLLGIALFVTLLATASTFLYFEQLRLVELTFPDTETRTRVFARIDWVVQGLTILSQLFITGRLAAWLGVVVLLTMVPLAMVFGFLALAVWNTFPVLAVVFVARRFGEYAFVRPGREMLWSPLDRETKYKAKNFIDVPVYRGADAIVAQMQQAVGNAGFGPQAIAMLGVASAAVWAVNGWWLGRRYDVSAADATAAATSASSKAAGLRPQAPGLVQE
jgi:AAA family ATP:ADP antiporter